jgi:hypothetical protein
MGSDLRDLIAGLDPASSVIDARDAALLVSACARRYPRSRRHRGQGRRNLPFVADTLPETCRRLVSLFATSCGQVQRPLALQTATDEKKIFIISPIQCSQSNLVRDLGPAAMQVWTSHARHRVHSNDRPDVALP